MLLSHKFSFNFSALQNPSILDPEAEIDATIRILQELYDKVDELIQRSLKYRGFQKNFKVEVTKYEELEEVNAEIKDKQLLWNSLSKWDEALEEWMQVIFYVSFFLSFLYSRKPRVIEITED